MKSKDVEQLTREELAQKFNKALESGDAEQVAQAMAEMAENIQNEILERAKGVAAVEQLDALGNRLDISGNVCTRLSGGKGRNRKSRRDRYS